MRKPLAEEDCELQFFVRFSRLRFVDGFFNKESPADYMAAKADYNKEVVNHG